MIWALALAHAQSPMGSDRAVTTLGVQQIRTEAIDQDDVDLLVGQRVRWGLADQVTLLADGRFTVDPNGATSFEQSRVRSLGVVYEGAGASILAGRHALRHGGPRLVDGAQLLLHPGQRSNIDLGLWGGLLADPFTTAPTLRPGAGPVAALLGSIWSASALGEFVAGAEGLDRIGTLFQVRGNWAPRAFVNGRLDLLVTDGQGRSGLADAALAGTLRATDALTLSADVNAFSSLRYQTLAAVDPTVQRFTQRVADLDLQLVVLSDDLDPTLQTTAGASARLRPRTSSVRPILGLSGRVRNHPDPLERYARVGPQLGVAGLASDRLEILADGNLWSLEGRLQGDSGLNVLFDVTDGGTVLIDTSARALFDPVGYDSPTPGAYVDVFVDGVARSGTVVAVGASWTSEPSDAVGSDVGWGAFLRIQQWIRPKRSVRGIAGDDTNDSAGDASADGEEGDR